MTTIPKTFPKTSQNYSIQRASFNKERGFYDAVGKVLNLWELDVLVNEFRAPSPAPNHVKEEVPGRHGFLDMGTTYAGREMSADHIYVGRNTDDFWLWQPELYELFQSEEPFFLMRDAEPGKRQLVKCTNSIDIEQTGTIGRFTVEFESASSFAESINRSITPRNFNQENYQFGMGLIAEDLTYEFTTNTFRVWNAGKATLNPRNMDIVITIKAAVASRLRLINLTTNETFEYNEPLAVSDTLRLKAPGWDVTRNGLAAFRHTNHRVFVLKPGWNEFRVEGASTIQQILFDFRFYYR